MKLSKSILASVFLLAFTAFGAAAAPEPPSVPAEKAALAEAPSDLFGASLLGQGNCDVAAQNEDSSLDPSMCGACSALACRGVGVGYACGIGGGYVKYCQDSWGLICAVDGGTRCQCTSGIVP